MRVLITIDLLLAIFFSAQTLSLCHRIEKMKLIKFNQPVYDISQYQRQPVYIPASFENMFGMKQTVVSTDTTGPDSKPVAGKESVDEIRSGEETLRLRGIFIADNVRNAYISIVNSKRQGAEVVDKLNKYKTGDRIFDLTITEILSDRLVLSSLAAPQVTLRIYKPLTVTTING